MKKKVGSKDGKRERLGTFVGYEFKCGEEYKERKGSRAMKPYELEARNRKKEVKKR